MPEITETLSLWRSPLDKVALVEAHALSARQPVCAISYDENFSAMTIYNFGYYIIHYGPTADASLTKMLADMGGTSGGLAFIPQEQFMIDAAAFGVPDQCNFVSSGGGGATGSSGGSPFSHFFISSITASSSFLDCNTSGQSSGGVYFKGLAFQWKTGAFHDDTCIVAGVENVRAIRCTFTDCPQAFNANGVSCALEQCTISYTVSAAVGPNNTTAVVLRAPQCGVIGPGVLSQTSQSSPSGGATGCTCISIQGAKHALIANVQLYEWTIGVDFSQGGTGQTLAAQITNCEIECWQHALNIVSPNSSSTVAGIKITSCTLAKTSDSNNGDPIVKIDANLGNLHDITLLDCTVFCMASAITGQHGLSILGGMDIKVIGGTYSGNSSGGGAGIAIVGASGIQITDVQIIGANLRPSYPGSPNSQQWALLITNGSSLSGALVSGCDMTGYVSGAPVSVSGSPANLLIRDCPGYNDQNTTLMATTSQLTTGVSASSCNTPYYGPSVITYTSTAPVTLHIFGQTITASMGIIFLPNPYDSFYFSVRPGVFSWTGK